MDSHGLMQSIYNDLNNYDVNIAYNSKVKDITLVKNGFLVKIKNPDGNYDEVETRILINAAGLNSYKISKMVGVDKPSYKLAFWKGEYFSVKTKSKLLNSLIYPLPMNDYQGLGIHTTIDIAGRLRLGPNAVYLGNEFDGDYSINNESKNEFYKAAKQYLPFLSLKDLEPDQSGVRPKLQKPGEPFRDFIINNEKLKNNKTFINLIGIESPGLTSSLAIGEYVKNMVDNIENNGRV